jgi:hypothetical protein
MSEVKDSTPANRDHNLQEASARTNPQQPHAPNQAPNAAPSGQLYEEARRRYRLVRTTQIIWLVLSVLEALFAIRFLLKLMAANPAAGFAIFIYNTTAVFLTPFFDLTPTPSVNGSQLEFFTLIAMLFYALLAWGIVRVLWIIFERPEI